MANPETLMEWFKETSVSRTAKELFFGKYLVYVDEGFLVMRNSSTGQINPVKGSAAGELSENARFVLSENRKKDGESGNAGFFVLDEGRKNAVYASITYGKEEVEMRFNDRSLGFALSDDYRASACDGSLLVLDRALGRYILSRADRSTLSAKLDLEKGSECFMVSREVGLITNGNEVHVIHGNSRDLIDAEELAKRNGVPLSEPGIGLGFEEEHWLAVKGKGWKRECLLIALSGKEKFCYRFAALSGAFESEEGSEGIRK